MPSVGNSSGGGGGNDARLSYVVNQVASASASQATFPTFSPPRIESLVASSSAEDLSSFGDVTFDLFDDDDDLFGSPMAFDGSENGLWNGRFVPPPPRPPFFVDEPVLSDGLTTCDLCSWAMPTKSTFMFEGTIEKATELGWPLTLIIVSVLSALLGAIIMIAVVRCRRKKSSNNRNDTHVQWWSRNKRAHANGLNGANGGAGGAAGGAAGHHPGHHHHHHHGGSSSNINNNHLRRSNIYTAHPADSIRGLQPLPVVLPLPLTLQHPQSPTAQSGSQVAAPSAPSSHYFHPFQQQQHLHHPHQHQHHHHHVPLYPQQQQQQDCDEDAAYEEPEYHQPQILHSANSSSSLSSVESTPMAREAAGGSQWPPAATAASMVIAS
ncbi:uncharacterized protein [Drosophila kikkawai]|uniref:Uncharacterized protein n=1 Tax=Drosophila kikkawai TaxID=30033 RepID=A0A6P4I1T5_DROKI|nr:uncharacterized protein LOC108071635 [Drosophila kikkawai]